MKKRSSVFLGAAVALALELFARGAAALTIGTFNIEYFHIAGTGNNAMSHPAYTREDVSDIAKSIRKSGADVLALQEIQGEETMRFLTFTELRGWKYDGWDIDYRKRGWDTSRKSQNNYFIWNSGKVTLLGTPKLHYVKNKFEYAGRRSLLFDRPPMEARFRDEESGREFTLICVHLKSLSTAGKNDVKSARAYNAAKRAAQVEKLNELADELRGPAFILGDYNSPDAASEVSYPLLTLERGYTYDSWPSSIDFIGCVGIGRERLGTPKETETRIDRRSTRRKDHPDHDILALDVRL